MAKTLKNVHVRQVRTTANHDPLVDTISRRFGRADLGRACGPPRTCKDLFALNLNDMALEERKLIHTTIPELVVDLRALAGCVRFSFVSPSGEVALFSLWQEVGVHLLVPSDLSYYPTAH